MIKDIFHIYNLPPPNDIYVPPYPNRDSLEPKALLWRSQNVIKLHESLGMKPGYKTTKLTRGNNHES